jgi:hypothetical protein
MRTFIFMKQKKSRALTARMMNSGNIQNLLMLITTLFPEHLNLFSLYALQHTSSMQ